MLELESSHLGPQRGWQRTLLALWGVWFLLTSFICPSNTHADWMTLQEALNLLGFEHVNAQRESIGLHQDEIRHQYLRLMRDLLKRREKANLIERPQAQEAELNDIAEKRNRYNAAFTTVSYHFVNEPQWRDDESLPPHETGGLHESWEVDSLLAWEDAKKEHSADSSSSSEGGMLEAKRFIGDDIKALRKRAKAGEVLSGNWIEVLYDDLNAWGATRTSPTPDFTRSMFLHEATNLFHILPDEILSEGLWRGGYPARNVREPFGAEVFQILSGSLIGAGKHKVLDSFLSDLLELIWIDYHELKYEPGASFSNTSLYFNRGIYEYLFLQKTNEPQTIPLLKYALYPAFLLGEEDASRRAADFLVLFWNKNKKLTPSEQLKAVSELQKFIRSVGTSNPYLLILACEALLRVAPEQRFYLPWNQIFKSMAEIDNHRLSIERLRLPRGALAKAFQRICRVASRQEVRPWQVNLRSLLDQSLPRSVFLVALDFYVREFPQTLTESEFQTLLEKIPAGAFDRTQQFILYRSTQYLKKDLSPKERKTFLKGVKTKGSFLGPLARLRVQGTRFRLFCRSLLTQESQENALE